MDAQFWHDRWLANQIGFHQSDVNNYLQQYSAQWQLEKGQVVFVPLCGKSLDMLWLLDQGYRVIGIELSAIAVESFFVENKLIPTIRHEGHFTRWILDELEIWCGDFFDLAPELLPTVHAVYDRAALIALPPEMRPRYQQHLARFLSSGTKELLITLDYPQSLVNGPPFAVAATEVLSLCEAQFTVELLSHVEMACDNAKFRQAGIQQWTEQVFLLTRN
jgi:thiopurine S-methyltransferase